ncbi:hypothetical protein PENSPDRAFT_347818 [Peniophora sp. CONT]|nr:hypothetical protein PENSPDRAFT_347818 [Peniophora sp. CONT]
MPPLIYLRRIAVYTFVDDDDDITPGLVFAFLDGHPSVEEVTWKSSPTLPWHMPMQVPRLPAVKRMLNMTNVHVLAYMRSEHGSSPVLGWKLDTVTLALLEGQNWDWKYLNIVFPISLRVLHIQSLNYLLEGYETLDALRKAFPGLEELFLPNGGSRYRVKLTDEEKRAYSLGRTPNTKLVDRCPHIDEIMERFPSLRFVAGVECALDVPTQRIRAFHANYATGGIPSYFDMKFFFEVSSSLIALRSSYPRLRAVNGWRLDTDLRREVIMSMEPGDNLRRDGTGVQVVLTRASLSVRYPGSLQAGSQPLPLEFKEPYPIARTYYLDEDY